jgi:hypothetical protein
MRVPVRRQDRKIPVGFSVESDPERFEKCVFHIVLSRPRIAVAIG